MSRLTYEHRHGKIVVHSWGVWPSYSVLAGQDKKSYVAQFDTVEEAEAAYPEATPSHPMLQAGNHFGHL